LAGFLTALGTLGTLAGGAGRTEENLQNQQQRNQTEAAFGQRIMGLGPEFDWAKQMYQTAGPGALPDIVAGMGGAGKFGQAFQEEYQHQQMQQIWGGADPKNPDEVMSKAWQLVGAGLMDMKDAVALQQSFAKMSAEEAQHPTIPQQLQALQDFRDQAPKELQPMIDKAIQTKDPAAITAAYGELKPAFGTSLFGTHFGMVQVGTAPDTGFPIYSWGMAKGRSGTAEEVGIKRQPGAGTGAGAGTGTGADAGTGAGDTSAASPSPIASPTPPGLINRAETAITHPGATLNKAGGALSGYMGDGTGTPVATPSASSTPIPPTPPPVATTPMPTPSPTPGVTIGRADVPGIPVSHGGGLVHEVVRVPPAVQKNASQVLDTYKQGIGLLEQMHKWTPDEWNRTLAERWVDVQKFIHAGVSTGNRKLDDTISAIITFNSRANASLNAISGSHSVQMLKIFHGHIPEPSNDYDKIMSNMRVLMGSNGAYVPYMHTAQIRPPTIPTYLWAPRTTPENIPKASVEWTDPKTGKKRRAIRVEVPD
jgi:hypothetical protein